MTIIKKSYKFRIYPNKEQLIKINQTIGSARFIYNKMLEDKIKHYNEHKESLNNTPAQYKNKYKWLRDVDSQALSQSHQDLNAAFRNFFRKNPKFKRKGVKDTYNFGKSVHDNGWGMFVQMLKYKLEESGKQLIVADKFFPSTKQCSSCKNKKESILLSERIYSCEHCKLSLDRDLNAAINLKQYGIESIRAN